MKLSALAQLFNLNNFQDRPTQIKKTQKIKNNQQTMTKLSRTRISPLMVTMLLSLGTLTACGGGGSGGSTTVTTRTTDTTAPVITITGDSTVTHDAGSPYTDLGASATDNIDGEVSVTTTGEVNTEAVDSYIITYSASDAAGNESSKVRTVNVVDTTAPVISITGDSSITHDLGYPYTDLGATATDNIDGDVTVITTGEVNTMAVDSYTLTYNATDEAGNESSIERTVNVIFAEDVIAPVITLNGNNTVTHAVGTTYIDLGATALDNVDSVVSVITTGSVNDAVMGSYTITYQATDVTGNQSSMARTVNVADLTAPVITLTGDSTITHNAGTPYTDQGASAIDNVDGVIGVTTTGSVDTAVMGSYIITYQATDAAGNLSSVARTVNVDDITAPIITLNGDSTINHNYGDAYTDLGATATDNVDASVTVVSSGGVTIDMVNSYTITYTATDAAGNEATLDRTVNVADLEGPVITLIGDSTVTLGQYRLYNELGATALDNLDGDITVNAPVGTVDDSIIGQYLLTYSAIDAAGNESTLDRTVNVIESRPFITTWKTDNNGVSADNEITITTNGDFTGYDYSVDWGDGSTDENLTGDHTHTYGVAGTYTVSINGVFKQLYFDDNSYDNEKLLTVEQWGDVRLSSMNKAFAYCINLISNATDTPNLRDVRDMIAMFINADNFNQDISNWDVSEVTHMAFMFFNAISFNQDISAWDVSAVTDMKYMFYNASDFDQDISAWDVSGVTDMSYMFYEAGDFNQNIGIWDVSKVNDMNHMFYRAFSFEQNIGTWDVSKVEIMRQMFRGVALTTENYDALLTGWSALSLKNSVTFDGGNSKYSSSVQAARDILTSSPNDWTVTDAGVE